MKKSRANPGASRMMVATPMLRILVIEDNADAAESLKEALQLSGHAVETAGTGDEGVSKARAFHPDVVLCDLGLPGMDGFEVARRFRSDPELRSSCLLALSGYTGPDEVEKCKAAGFEEHLAKPMDPFALEASITHACRGNG